MFFRSYLFLVLLLAGHSGPIAQAQAPSDRQLVFEQALGKQKQGDYDGAIRQYRELLKTSPGLLPAWVNLGVSLVQAGRFAEAVQSYQSALALDPDNRRIQNYLGLAYLKSGDGRGAAHQFEQLLQTDPKDFHNATLLAAAYLQLGDNVRALSVLSPLVPLAGEDPDFLWAFASALIANGNLEQGVTAAEQVARRTHAAEAWKLAGENRLVMNEFPRAREDMEAAALADPDLPGVQTVLGQAREKNADYAGAIEAFQKAVAQNPKDFAAWLNLGSDQYFIRDLNGARASLERALFLNSESAPAFYALALVDKNQGNAAAAALDLERVVKIMPTWLEAHVQLAALYMQTHQAADSARERKIVDRLTEEQQKAGPPKF